MIKKIQMIQKVDEIRLILPVLLRTVLSRTRIWSLGVLVPLAALVSVGMAQAGPEELGGRVPTRVLIKLTAGTTPSRLADGRWTLLSDGPARQSGSGAGAIGNTPVGNETADLLENWNVLGIGAAAHHEPANAALARSLGLDRFYAVEVPAGTDLDALIESLSTLNDEVELAELDPIGGIATIPDDEGFGLQYALGLIDALDAWDITTGSAEITLAVLDSGTIPHIELAERIVPGSDVSTPGGDETVDGCGSHGTHVSGIAAATGNNAAGIAGMNWGVKIMPVKILSSCAGPESYVADGITFAVDAGADVINMSLQYSGGSDYLHTAVQYAYESGVIMVAAAGNNGFSNGVAFPGRWPETITVAGTTAQDLPPTPASSGWTSNAGPEVDVAAPGDQIYSLIGDSSYGFKSGTSMATPHVSGLVAMMLTIDPTLGTEEIRTILQETATDLLEPGFDEATGWGRIEAGAALAAVAAGLTTPGDVNTDGVVDVADLLHIIETWGVCPEEGPCPTDLDGNGLVGASDLIIVLINWT